MKLSLGSRSSFITNQDGSVWAVGGNKFGELGTHLSSESVTDFVEIFSDGANAATAIGGGAHTMVLKQDGSVWATGRNQHGQLGDESNTDRQRFVKVISGGVKAVVAGSKHSLVVKEDDSVWATGCNMYGQLGDGSEVDKNTFVQTLLLLRGVKGVAAGTEHSLVLGLDGSVWATGANFFGQLGDPSIMSTASLVRVLFTGGEAIAVGGYHSWVLKQDGTIWAVGANQYGQLGDGTTTNRRSIREITDSEMRSFNAKVVAAGTFHSIVLGKDGGVWVTGLNDYGQLGDGSWVPKRSFVRVVSEGQVVAAGGWHSMVLKRDGSFWASGKNTEGQLGDGSMTDRTNFVRLSEMSDHGAYRCAVVTMVCSSRVTVAPFFIVSSYVCRDLSISIRSEL